MNRLKIIIQTFIIVPFIVGCKPALDCYILPSVESSDCYKAYSVGSKAHVTMARNESEHFQIVFKGSPGASYSISRKNGQQQIAFQCRQLTSVNQYKDALVPCDGQINLTDSIGVAWITYNTAVETIPGSYQEEIVVEGEGMKQDIQVTIDVHETTLPVTPSIPAAFGIITKYLVDPQSEENTVLNKEKWAELCLSYRMNPYFSTWLEGSMRHEASSSPYEWNDQRTKRFLSDPRFNRFALPFHSLSDKDLKSMLHEAMETGVLAKSYFYLWDEPSLIEEYVMLKQYSKRIHEIAPDAKILTTFYCGPKDGSRKDDLFAVFDLWKGDTQIYSMSSWALQNDESNAAKSRSLLKGNEEWWTYVCMGPGEKQPNLLLEMTGFQHRAVMWRSWKDQTSGFLYWAVNAYGDANVMTFRDDLPDGDGVLIYPGKEFNYDGLVVSVRMERWRDSMEDYEYLALLEKQIGRSNTEKIFSEIYRGPSDYTNSVVQIEKFRSKILEVLENR